ncbi:MAG: DMT family transporter [Alphaproteobacteria bacterium]|nr:DMT family transporter [Alphaproteobacteria bacterium]
MVEIWIPITIAAAFFQNLRSALQKYLKGKLSNAGAAYARFFYAWPFALLYLWGLNAIGGYPLPEPNLTFLIYCVLGGISQILFTVILLWMFSFRNFAVGTTFSKLELVMIAALGALILGDGLSLTAIVAVALSALGVVILSAGQSAITLKTITANLVAKPTLIGLTSAVFLGASVVCFRGATLSLGHDNITMTAAYSLAVSIVIQTVVMGVYLLWREPGEIGRVITNWRWAGAVSIVGVLGSVCWFTAFTIENAAHVRAVGQIELVFTFIASSVFFKETVSKLEILGIVLVVGAILLVLVAG